MCMCVVSALVIKFPNQIQSLISNTKILDLSLDGHQLAKVLGFDQEHMHRELLITKR